MSNNSIENSRINIWLPFLLAAVLVGGILIGMRLQSERPDVMIQPAEGVLLSESDGKVEELLRYIEAKYVDDVNREQLVNKAIETVLEQLDPHSSYISKEELQEVTEQLEGNFEGIGVEFMMVEDTVVVVSAISGGPAEEVGILPGDKIIFVEDSLIAGQELSNRDIISLLKGEKGTEVDVKIKRGSASTLIPFTITRDRIPINSVDVNYMVDKQTGYIKISRFSATTDKEFLAAVEDMVENHDMEDLIIDLRQNPGGYLQKATNILSQLFPQKGELLVYTEGRAVNRSDYESSGRTFFDINDIAVLIDEGSASASEILAGAIQDHDRGYVIGRRSFGKGLVQEQYRLSDGSALRLTVARYYTPSGRLIQKPYDDLDSYNHDMETRFESGELVDKNNISLNDSTRYFTDRGRVVYGGGGITPDVFIPLDTTLLDEEFMQLRLEIPNYVFQYLDSHQEQLSNLNFESFIDSFQLENEEVDAFLAFAEQEGVALSYTEKQQYRDDIKQLIKARIGKHLFDAKGLYTVFNQDDKMIKKALELLKNGQPISAMKMKD